jgi:peptide-methionine (S)-S-oxide reductase
MEAGVKALLMGVLVMAGIWGASCVRAETVDLPKPVVDDALTPKSEQRTAVLASGCFWCAEVSYQQLPGVTKVVSGYAGDSKETADYETVSSHMTNHAECVQVTYDASKLTYGKLLQVFFYIHDPTTLNRQGPDEGRQYRSAIFYANDDQKRIAEAYIRQLTDAKAFDEPIVTTLEKLTAFYPAETYHQNYAKEHPLQPYIQRYALPKAEKVKKHFGAGSATQP